MARRRATLVRLALGQAAILLLVLAALLGGAYAVARRSLLVEAKARLDAIVGTMLADFRLNQVIPQIADLVRTTENQRPRLLLRLENVDGSCPAMRCPGNVSTWPASVPPRPGTFMSTGGASTLVRVEQVDRLGVRLLVGQELSSLDAMNTWLAPALGGAALLSVVGVGLLGLFAARTLLARVEAMNAFCNGLGEGSLDRRLAVRGTDEFATLSGNINAMLDRMQGLMSLLSQMTSHAAHELRTPLASLRLLLETGLRAARETASRDAMATGVERIDEMLDIFNKLLEIARTEAHDPIPFEMLDLAEVLRPTLAMFELSAEEAGLRLRADLEAARLAGSPRLMQMLLANLVSNALKFSPPGTEVTVRTGEADGRVFLSVADQGPGIPPDQAATVFDYYTRLSRTSDRPGYGLGLPLVRAIAHRHDLSITLKDAAPGLRVVVAGAAAVPKGGAASAASRTAAAT